MKKKILIIEDQKELVKLLSARLKAAGYEVLQAFEGPGGLDAVIHQSPDLVITDLAMPGMPGNTIVRILKSSEKYRHIPIIMLSAFVTENAKISVEVPADFYMTKPYQSDVLMAKIKELLGG